MKTMYRAEGAKGVYTIDREIAGGGFYLNLNGFCLAFMYGGRLAQCRHAARQYENAPLVWEDCAEERYR